MKSLLKHSKISRKWPAAWIPVVIRLKWSLSIHPLVNSRYIGHDDDDDECFCGMVDRRKAFCFISSQDHCQRSSPLRISDTSQARFECPENLSSGLVEWSCAVVVSTTPGRHWELGSLNEYKLDKNTLWIFEIYGDTNLFNLVHYTCFIRLEEATCATLKKK